MRQRWYEWLCEKLTDHKFRKLQAWSSDIEPQEFHWECKVCKHHFWNFGTKQRDKDIIGKTIYERHRGKWKKQKGEKMQSLEIWKGRG